MKKSTMNCRWIWIIFIPIWLVASCETRLTIFYVKARDSEELKISAFERCGRHYRVLAYEEDTARIECLKKTD